MAGDTETHRLTQRDVVGWGHRDRQTESDTQTDTERCSWLGTQGQTDRVTHRLTQRGVVGWGHRDRLTQRDVVGWGHRDRQTE